MSAFSGKASTAPVRFREEFRAPAGVRKSPRKEPAGHSRWLWGFRSAADVVDGVTAAGKRGGGCGQATSLLLCAVLRPCTRFVATLSAAIVTEGARGSVAGGGASAAVGSTMPCGVMGRSPGLLPIRAAVRAAASTFRTPR